MFRLALKLIIIVMLSSIVCYGAQSSLQNTRSKDKKETKSLTLEKGKVVEQAIKEGETHYYKLVLAAGERLTEGLSGA